MTDQILDNETQAAPSAEVVKSSEVATLLTGPAVHNELPRQSITSLDSASKTIAITLVFIYISGFLITSLHNFQYGFSEMNPLRPRILAAGGWFGIFIAVPFALVWELRKHSAIKEKKNISTLSTLVAAYMTSALFLMNFSSGLFAFDDTSGPSKPLPYPWWEIALFVLGIAVVAAILATVVTYAISKVKPNYVNWSVSVFVLIFYGYLVGSAYSDIFMKHSFTSNAMYLWILMIGGYIYFELSQRDWTLKVGVWQRALIGFFITMTIFATVYYPHIRAKWGGGTLIPIELTFSKDAPVRPGVVIDCSLIDETDAGFYIIESGGTSATFIPRTEISSIYYGQGNQHSVFSEDQQQQSAPSLPASTPANKPPIPQEAPSQPISTIGNQPKSQQPK